MAAVPSEKAEVTTIHPIFPIEEKARIFRVCVWFNPPHPPTKIEISAASIMK